MKLLLSASTTYALDEVLASASHALGYIEHLQQVAHADTYDDEAASLHLAFDDALLEQVEQVCAQKVTKALRYIFVVGIGGSNLGTKAVYDALYGFGDVAAVDRPKLIFIDTTNEVMLRYLTDTLIPTLAHPEEYVLVAISKSGGTTETLANAEILLAALYEHVGSPQERIVVITDDGSAFAQAAEAGGITTLSIPHHVGGRYSVLSAVGLFPLMALGVDVVALRQGARDIRAYCLNTDIAHNPAWQSAALLAFALRDGKTINDSFVFNSELESLGKWYRQLLGESIGKEYTRSGTQVRIGITPTVSVGSTDLHSVGQLYLGGPKDKLTTFMYAAPADNALVVPSARMFPGTVSIIEGKSTTDIMSAILGGVKIAYNKQQLPFMEIELAAITPYELGACMQFKMIEMMILGHLLEVNPFDQPNVESYKVETRELLER